MPYVYKPLGVRGGGLAGIGARRRFVAASQMAARAPPPRPLYQTVPRSRGVYASGEMKYFDSYKAVTAIAAGTSWAGQEYDPGTLNTLFAPTTGSTIASRIAREATVYKIKVRGTLFCAVDATAAAAFQPSLVRLMLVQDTQTNGAQAQAEEIMAAPGAATAQLTNKTFTNLASTGRFRIWKDITVNLQDPNMVQHTSGSSTIKVNGINKPFKFNLDFSKAPIKVRFNATDGGSVADIVDNSWHIIAHTTSADMTPQICYQCRVSFKG